MGAIQTTNLHLHYDIMPIGRRDNYVTQNVFSKIGSNNSTHLMLAVLKNSPMIMMLVASQMVWADVYRQLCLATNCKYRLSIIMFQNFTQYVS